MGAGAVAGVMMILAEFLLIRYVTTITASCSDLASPAVRDSCSTTGHESHYWGIAILGLLTIVMAFGAAAGRSRPAALGLLAAGLVGLGITLIHDLPDTSSKGEVGSNFASAQAHIGLGFWFELVGALLAVGAAAFALTLLPEVAPAEGEVDGEEEAAEAEALKDGEPPAADEARETDATAEGEPEGVGASSAVSAAEAPADEVAARATRAERIRAARRTLGERLRRRRPPAAATPADVGADEGSEGEAVEPDSAEAAKTEDAGARAAKAETVEAETAEADAEAESAPPEPEGDTWDVIPDTPAARRSAERRRKRQERAEAARKRQKRPPRERDRKKKPKDD